MTRGPQPTSPRPADTIQIVNRSIGVNCDAWNRYVLVAIGLFAVLLYVGLIYAGLCRVYQRVVRTKGAPGVASHLADCDAQRFRGLSHRRVSQ